MIYITVALYIEAKPIIENFNLKKNNFYNKFQVFSNEKICLIISGIGKINSAIALSYLASKIEKIKENDFILNIGFAGSLNKNFNLNDTVLINKITNLYAKKSNYLEILYKNNFKESHLLTFDKVIDFVSPILEENNFENTLVDMEGFGFFEAAKIFFKRDKIIILKIVSDIIQKENIKTGETAFANTHCFPFSARLGAPPQTPYKTRSQFINSLDIKKNKREILDFKNCDFNEIYKEIFSFLENLINIFPSENNFFSEEEEKYINKISSNLKLSQTMNLEFLNIIKYYKLSENNILKFLKEYEKIEIKNKNEGKRYFEDIKKRIING